MAKNVELTEEQVEVVARALMWAYENGLANVKPDNFIGPIPRSNDAAVLPTRRKPRQKAPLKRNLRDEKTFHRK